jgi:Domain of unknown function (DUF4188)
MGKVAPGRYTARPDGDFVLFLIGMRINRVWKVHKWLPVARAMGPMLRELEAHPEKGMIHSQGMLMGASFAFVQYWRSFEHLEAFARNPDDPHLPAWTRFNQLVRDSGDVGIWHETYRVTAGDCEAVYGNMPRWGLAGAFEHVPVGSTIGQSAAKRIGASTSDETPVEPY